MANREFTQEELNNLSKEEMFELLKGLVHIVPEQEKPVTDNVEEIDDDDFFFDEEDEEIPEERPPFAYSKEEMNGPYERYTEEEIKEVIKQIDENAGKEIPTSEEVAKKELERETSLAELQKTLKAIQHDKRVVQRRRFIRDVKENLIIGASAVAKTVADVARSAKEKANKYAEDYESAKSEKSSIVEQYNRIRDSIDNEWIKAYDEFQEEIKGLQQAESSQAMRLSGYINKKNNIMQKRQEKSAEAEAKLIEDYRSGNTKSIIETVNDIKRYNSTIKKYDMKISEEQEKLDAIRADIASCEQKLQEKENEANERLTKAIEDKNTQIANIQKQNIFQKAIGKIVNIFHKVKHKDSKDGLEEYVARMKETDLPNAQAETERISNERAAREEEYDDKYWNNNRRNWQDRVDESKQKREADKQRREEQRKAREEKEKEKLQARIAKAQEALRKEQSLYTKRQIATEGR